MFFVSASLVCSRKTCSGFCLLSEFTLNSCLLQIFKTWQQLSFLILLPYNSIFLYYFLNLTFILRHYANKQHFNARAHQQRSSFYGEVVQTIKSLAASLGSAKANFVLVWLVRFGKQNIWFVGIDVSGYVGVVNGLYWTILEVKL